MFEKSAVAGEDRKSAASILFFLIPFFRPTIVNEWQVLSPLKSLFSIWLLVACVGIIIRFVMRNGRIGLFLSGLIVMLAIMLASTMMNAGSLYDAMTNSAMLLGAALLVISLETHEVKVFFSALAKLLLLFMGSELLLRLFLPRGIYLYYGIPRWLFQNGSLQSRWSFILVFVAAVLDYLNYGRNRRLFYLSSVLSIMFSLQLASATSTVALIIEIIIIHFAHNAWMQTVTSCRRVCILVLILTVAIVIFRVARYLPYEEIARFLGKNLMYMQGATFSGRTYIWDSVIESIIHSPLFGYGYQQVVASGLTQFYSQTDYSSAHNLWLQIAFQGGLTSLVAFSLSFYSVCMKADNLENGYFRVLYAGLLTSFLLTSVFENTLNGVLILALAIPSSSVLVRSMKEPNNLEGVS